MTMIDPWNIPPMRADTSEAVRLNAGTPQEGQVAVAFITAEHWARYVACPHCRCMFIPGPKDKP